MRSGWLAMVLAAVALPVSAQPERLPEQALDAQRVEEALPEGEYADVDQEIDPELRERLAEATTPSDAPEDATPAALPTGTEAKSAVEPSRISLPSAEASVEGMGESFTPNLSSGTGTYGVPIAIPSGRNGIQPSLSLSYSTGGGNGSVGFGWSLGAPFIARQTDRGMPGYDDRATWHPEEDRFIYNGGSELVPVDSAAMARVDASGDGSIDASRVPDEVRGWQQYRARIEGAFMRFFRSPDARRWVVQAPDGTRYDFGVLEAGDGPPDLDSTTSLVHDEGRIGRWLLTRMSDAHGSTIYYRYVENEGFHYLADVFYLSPNSCASSLTDLVQASNQQRRCAAPLSDYGMRVGLRYETRQDVFTRWVLGWPEGIAWRLKEIVVTAAEETVGQRYLVRRYHLGYDADAYHSLLASVQVEGRPEVVDPHAQVPVAGPRVREEDIAMGPGTGRTLPPMRFHYSDGPAGGPLGFSGIDATVHPVIDSPDVSADAARADLFDVNSDGLADLVVTDPSRYRTADGQPAVGVFFNGFQGTDARPAGRAGVFSDAIPVSMPPELAGSLLLGNANVVPMDVDGDGRSDLLHMPRRDSYGFFTPARTNPDARAVRPTEQGWRFVYGQVALERGGDPRVDWVRDGAHYRVLDVNGDHLIDIVKTTGTAIHTWLNLGWLPGGDGRFGHATFDGRDWQLSAEPLESCLLHDGLPVDFADPDVRLADMNGDGLQDIVRIGRGRVVYWPGRGLSRDGGALWGVGPSTCAPGEGEGREIAMAGAPHELSPELDSIFLADVDADGASDIVQVRFDELDVWMNTGGEGFTERTTIGVPMAPGFAPRIRFTDIDGSGTTDLVYANAGAWQFVDLLGGQKPRLLVGVDNGLGATTTLTYSTSAVDYTADLVESDGCPGCETFTWQVDGRTDVGGSCDGDQRLYELSGECVYRSSGSPVVSTVVRSTRTSDNFHLLGREENVVESRYAYHDGYYEGIEQEFRGFGCADTYAVGDEEHPSQWTRTWFHQGRRPDAIASDRLADNPREALKGRTYLTEAFDDAGVYLSSAHASTTVRRLAVGLDGRRLWHAFGSQTDQLLYDTHDWAPGGGVVEVPRVAFEEVSASGAIPVDGQTETGSIPVRGARWAWTQSTTDVVDNVGRVRESTAHGRVKDQHDAAPTTYAEAIVSHAGHTLLNGSGQWIWKQRSGHVSGDGATQPLGESETTFDARGDEAWFAAMARLPSSGGYDFGALVQADQVLQGSTVFDAWGNSVASCAGADLASDSPAACLRYSEVEYDAYAHLPVLELAAVDGSSGAHCARVAPFCMLGTAAEAERGLGAVSSTTGPNGQRSRVAYDGVGRVAAEWAPPVDGCSGDLPTTRVTYDLAEPGRPVSLVESHQQIDCGDLSESLSSREYVDGATRTRATLSRRRESGRRWEQAGLQRFDALGSVAEEQTTPEWIHEPTYASAVAWAPRTSTRTVRDAFGRPTSLFAEDGSRSEIRYRALSQDLCDPLDLSTDPQFAGTCTTKRSDGHGRPIDLVQRQRRYGGGDEFHRLFTTYRADGAVTSVRRAETASDAVGAAIVDGHESLRAFVFDTAGRRIASTDPDSDNAAAAPGERTWRYLFNRAGDIAAVRDPRGCGQDFFYDRAGRLIGERYVGCAEAMAAEELTDEEVPAGSVGLEPLDGGLAVDVRSYYDVRPAWAGTFGALPASHDIGRQVAVSDRGQRSLLAVDPRGQVVWEGRQMAVVSAAPDVPTSLASPEIIRGESPTALTRLFDEAHPYVTTTTYDHAGRVVSRVFPEDPDWALMGGSGPAPTVRGRMRYDRLGLPARLSVELGSASYDIVDRISYTRRRSPSAIYLGDDHGGRRSTRVRFQYDVRERPIGSSVWREATGASGLSAVTRPFSHQYTWDAANNLTRRVDRRIPSEWPAGFEPRRERIAHDALYRVSNVDVAYRDDSWAWTTSDPATDWRDTRLAEGDADPMRRKPAPIVPALPSDRVVNFTYEWDWLANQTEWTDDAQSFYERSLGDDIGNGFEAGLRPSALYFASNIRSAAGAASDPSIDRGGWLTVDYGVSGNVEALTVRGQCHDRAARTCADPESGTYASRNAALDAGCECVVEQHYQYRWDELNRIAEARRYDRGGSGPWALQVRQRYRYDGANVRTIKQTLDGFDAVPLERAALYVYPGDFERRGVTTGVDRYEASVGLGTESQYNVAGARIVWKGDPAVGFARDARITYALSDLLHSTSAVVDLVSGELLEHTTFHPNGARETHLVNHDVERFSTEPIGFTGKEADEEVGLIYFGERYLIPRLGRWASPDPLHVHSVGGGEALNSYHYVSGNLLQARDPNGLDVEPYTEGAYRQSGWSGTPMQDGEPPMDTNYRPEEWNPNQPVPYYIGNAAHEAIGAYYTIMHFVTYGHLTVTNSRTVNMIARVLGGAGLGNTSVRPDIANLSTGAVYEIKPWTNVQGALAQLRRYVRGLGSTTSRSGAPFQAGPQDDPFVVGVLPAPGGRFVFWSPQAGVIVYRYYGEGILQWAPGRAGDRVATPGQDVDNRRDVTPTPAPATVPATPRTTPSEEDDWEDTVRDLLDRLPGIIPAVTPGFWRGIQRGIQRGLERGLQRVPVLPPLLIVPCEDVTCSQGDGPIA